MFDGSTARVHQPVRSIEEARHATSAAEYAAGRRGIEPTAADWRDAVLAIIRSVAGDPGSAHFVASTYRGREIWSVILCGQPVRVVYHPETALIITVLPRQSHNAQDDGTCE